VLAPDLEVDLGDVVVGDGEAAHSVPDRERPRFEARAVVPDDPDAVVDARDAEAPGGAGAADLRRCSRRVRLPVLENGDLGDRLARPERDLTKCALEAPVEAERDQLGDRQAAVALDLDRHVCGREGERLRRSVGRGEERRRDRQEEHSPQN
jgi:hypothetical protein